MSLTESDLIVSQQIEIANLKKILASYRESHSRIHNIIFCVGGPLNDNKFGYSKEQRSTFHWIAGELFDPCDFGCDCECH